MNGKSIKRKAFQVLGHNLRQGIVDKFMKLNKTGFSTEFFRADFSQFSGVNVKILLLQFQAFQGFSSNFLIFYLFGNS